MQLIPRPQRPKATQYKSRFSNFTEGLCGRGVLHSKNVMDAYRNLFGNVQKFENNIEIWKLKMILWRPQSLYNSVLQELVIHL